jgi:hypothetical protein
MANDDGSQSDAEKGELHYAGKRFPLQGRVLRLALWLAAHQARINDAAPESGQIWLSWKGQGLHSITGDIKTPLG